MNEGEPAKFTLKSSAGKPKPVAKWFKEEVEIQINSDLHEVTEEDNDYYFVIKVAKPEDYGNYTAVLQNEAGQVTSNKATLTVKCNNWS